MKPPKNGGEFWGFNEESDEDNYSFDEDEENTAGFKPILKARKKLLLFYPVLIKYSQATPMRIKSFITFLFD